MHHPPSNAKTPPGSSSTPVRRPYSNSFGRRRRLSSSTDSYRQGWFSRRSHLRKNSKNKRHPRSRDRSPEPRIELPAESVESLKASTQTICQDITTSKWLYHGAYVGNETRTMEFKQSWGKSLSASFITHVLEYGCAFLNSEGGSLVVGVKDDGTVCGVSASHSVEDKARKWVDYAMHLIKPALFPFDYTLSFLPVLTPGQQTRDLKVVCLTFKAPSPFTEPVLYSKGRGKVFVRRDASLQGPLSLPLIIEWYRQKFPFWLNHCLCNLLSNGPPFMDHRSMMDRIMALQNYGDEMSSLESEEDSTDSSLSEESTGRFSSPDRRGRYHRRELSSSTD